MLLRLREMRGNTEREREGRLVLLVPVVPGLRNLLTPCGTLEEQWLGAGGSSCHKHTNLLRKSLKFAKRFMT